MDGRGAPHQRPAPDRALSLAAAVAAAFLPLPALAAPSPTPSLDGLLASPPSADFVADTESSGTPIGRFDMGAYVEFLGPDNPTDALQALRDDGFVTGYGKSWTSQSIDGGMVELVIAFAGARGAQRWLKTAGVYARTSDFYAGQISVDGIGEYYGVKYANPPSQSFAQVVSFIKGNDYFLVGFVSSADDLDDSAATQGRRQYGFAPAESIRPADWPENASHLPFGLSADRLAVAALVAGLAVAALAGAVIVAAVLLMARRPVPPVPPG